MHPNIVEGNDLLIPVIGVVHVVLVYPSGAAIVLDANGVRWLVSGGVLATSERCLFSEKEGW